MLREIKNAFVKCSIIILDIYFVPCVTFADNFVQTDSNAELKGKFTQRNVRAIVSSDFIQTETDICNGTDHSTHSVLNCILT